MNQMIICEVRENKEEIVKISVGIIIFFGISVFYSLGQDTYPLYKTGFAYASTDMFYRNGRPIIALLYKLHDLSGLSVDAFYYISSILALIFLGISIYIFVSIIRQFIPNENKRVILSFMSIANVFIIEYFMFIEKFGFMLGILFCILALYYANKFYNENAIQWIVCAVIFMLLATFTYQGTIALFLILIMPLVFYHSKDSFQYVKNIIVALMIYAIPVMIDLLAFKFVFKSNRLNLERGVIENVKSTFGELEKLAISTFDILPHYFYELLFLFVVMCSIIVILFSDRKIYGLIHMLITVIFACVFPVASCLQGSGAMQMRIVYPIASLIPVLMLNSFVIINSKENVLRSTLFRQISILFVCVMVSLLTMQYLYFNKVYIDKYKLNLADELRSDYIGQAIEDYEKTTGEVIHKISFYRDAYITYPYYPHLYCNGDLLVSSYYTDWSNLNSLNYYLGTDYEKIEGYEKYERIYENRDWVRLSNEQLIFEGDTLHICVY